MKRTILTTVGTSLLNNRNRPWANRRPHEPLPEDRVADEWLKQVKFNDDREDPLSVVTVSAETHTWYRLGVFDDQESKNCLLVLIHSNTEDGEFCAKRLVTLATSKGIQAKSVCVDSLNHSEGKTFNRGLRQLARVIGEEIRKGQMTGGVEIAATGGFKAEIAIANLVGAVSDTPVHYIYQEFSSIVTIAPIPVALRSDWIGDGAGLKLLKAFESSSDLISISKIENLLKQDERLLTLLEIDGDCVGLNLLGELALRILEAPRQSWPPVSEIAPGDKCRLESAAHHRPRGWEQIVDTIARCQYVSSIRYDGSVAGGQLKEANDNLHDLIHRIDGSPELVLRISTTATTLEQRRLVKQLILKELKLG